MNTKTAKFHPHVHLENLLQQKFNVFVEVMHEQFPSPILNFRNKPIKARTTVMVYKSQADAIAAHKNKALIAPIAITTAECSVNDQFEKRVGLTKALRRMYEVLSKGEKE